MKIGQIAYTYYPITGGCETYIQTLRTMFANAGHSQTIYQVVRPGIFDKDVKLVPVFNLFKRKPLYFYNLFLNLYIKDLLKEDILIVHDPFHYPPVFWHKSIVVSHGVRWDRPLKSEYLYNKVHYVCGQLAMKYAYKMVINDTNFFRKLGYHIKPKEGYFQEIKKNRWFIPNCVNQSIFKKTAPIKELENLNTILVPRNIVRGRGIHLAISAFKEFNKKFKNTKLVVSGDFADSVYKSEIFRQIKELEIIGKIYFIGSIDWKTMPRIYSSSLMTIIPTLYEEGTSLSALESMSCGTATVSTNTGGLTDLPTIQSKTTSNDLSKKMIECFESRNEIAQKQQKEVKRTFNLKNFQKSWERVINS